MALFFRNLKIILKPEDRLNLASWCFKPSDFGCLKGDVGEIEFKPLTIICGENNTGKTWVMYALYAFLTQLPRISIERLGFVDLFNELEKEGQVALDLTQ